MVPDPKDYLPDDYTYVRGHVRRKRGSSNKGSDEGCFGLIVILVVLLAGGWMLTVYMGRYWVPVLIIIVIAAVVCLAIYAFLQSRNEDEDE